MTPTQRQRAEAISRLIRLGWNPPPPSDAVTQRILDDIARVGAHHETLELNDNEQVVLELAAQGDTVQEIATKLSVSTDTVKDRQTRVRLKLGARNTTHAVALWKDAA